MSFIDPLLALQDVDMQIWRCQSELKELPGRRKEEEERLEDAARQQARLEDAAAEEAGKLDGAATDGEKKDPTGKIAEIQAAFQSVRAEIADANAFLAEIDERKAEVEAKLEDLGARRAELAKAVRPEHLLIYDRLRISRRPTIAKLTGGTCSGCHLVQPPAVAHLVRRDSQLVTCEMCGRILY